MGFLPKNYPNSFVNLSRPKPANAPALESGLGLTISREFTRLMGGDMQVRSELGHGTTFCFEVLVEEGTSIAAKDKTDRRRVLHLRPGQKEIRILIADDRLENRELLQKCSSQSDL